MPDNDMLAGMLEGLGVPADNPEPEEPETPQETEGDTGADQNTDAPEDSASSDQTNDAAQNSDDTPLTEKQANAFAALRTQNAQKELLLKNIATALGVNTDNTEQMYKDLNTQVLQLKAKQDNIPIEVLRQLQDGQNAIAELRRNQYQRDTALGFQQLQKDYGLTQADLNKFATELLQAGLNPFASEVNVVEEYRRLHFNDIIEKAKADAIKEEQARSTNAKEHGATVDDKRGTNDDGATDKPITTQADLTAFFNNK